MRIKNLGSICWGLLYPPRRGYISSATTSYALPRATTKNTKKREQAKHKKRGRGAAREKSMGMLSAEHEKEGHHHTQGGDLGGGGAGRVHLKFKARYKFGI